MRLIVFITIFMVQTICYGQDAFESDPKKAKFITSDIVNFWKAFDQLETQKNPFKQYLYQGTIGLKDFIPYRIESAKNLLKTVKKRKNDYESIRKPYDFEQFNNRILGYYHKLDNLYEDSLFPPTYYIIGAFNAGGGATENGIVVAVEMLKGDLGNVEFVVVHELIHFNQKYNIGPIGKSTLLEQSIKEGSADFLAMLISGINVNERGSFKYGNANEQELCKEFVGSMNGTAFRGWLYGTKGIKEGRPSDLGYWIGYKICESYYSKSSDKQVAIREILNIRNFDEFLERSGFLAEYLDK